MARLAFTAESACSRVLSPNQKWRRNDRLRHDATPSADPASEIAVGFAKSGDSQDGVQLDRRRPTSFVLCGDRMTVLVNQNNSVELER
jgi:hypothetical protein